MGSIRDLSSGQVQLLQPEHLVGRSSACALRLDHRYTSTQHATLRWDNGRWLIRDLGSRNGTFVNGARLKPGDEYSLRRGATIAFGKPEEGHWELVDASSPPPMAVPLDGDEPIQLDGDLIALPSGDDPQATIYRGMDGSWLLELLDESVTSLVNLQTFEVARRSYRFCYPESVRTTALAPTFLELEVARLALTFHVSLDEEYVELRGTAGTMTLDFGARAHNYLLLTLARRRLADKDRGLPDRESGWIDQEELARDPSMAPPALNLDIFRLRKQFAAARVVDAAHIVERRPRSRQLRIGTGLLRIERL